MVLLWVLPFQKFLPQNLVTFDTIFFLRLSEDKVNWLMTENLSAQGRPDPRGRALLLLVCKENMNPLAVSDALKFITNELIMRKL